jgi:hypothetical protein
MKRKQDKPSAKARMKLKKARVIDLCVKKNMTIRQAVKILKAEGFETGVSRSRIGVALQEIAREAPQAVEQARREAAAELRGLKNLIATAARIGLKDQVQLLLQIHDRYSRLLGLDMPSKSIGVTVPVPIGVVAMDFSEPVERTPDLVSEQQYLDDAATAKALKGMEE